MVTAREKFIAKKLVEKHGVSGKVAGRYIYAGFSVTFNVKVGDYVFDFIAKKGEKYCIKVFDGKVTVTEDDVKKAADAANKLGCKPIIILYGSGPRVDERAIDVANELGVVFRRVRP